MFNESQGSNTQLKFSFSKTKFLGLPLKRQHKKCALVLKELYLAFDQRLHSHYNEIQNWMGGDTFLTHDRKAISDRYHVHLKLAGISYREHHLLPRISKEDRAIAKPLWPIHVYLDRIRSAFNVGSIIRTAETIGFESLYFHPQTPYVDHHQVQQSSMGTHQWVNCQKVENINALPGPIIVMETSQDAYALHEFLFPESFTLVLGNEEYGVSEHMISNADYFINIPMRGKKNSLNVSNAFAMAAMEIYRQRILSHESV